MHVLRGVQDWSDPEENDPMDEIAVPRDDLVHMKSHHTTFQ